MPHNSHIATAKREFIITPLAQKSKPTTTTSYAIGLSIGTKIADLTSQPWYRLKQLDNFRILINVAKPYSEELDFCAHGVSFHRDAKRKANLPARPLLNIVHSSVVEVVVFFEN
jgi:hypothetical protein